MLTHHGETVFEIAMSINPASVPTDRLSDTPVRTVIREFVVQAALLLEQEADWARHDWYLACDSTAQALMAGMSPEQAAAVGLRGSVH